MSPWSLTNRVYDLLDRGLNIRRSEVPLVSWSFLYFFFLLSGYYVLRPIRDEMGIQGGVENLPWMFTGTFIGTLLVVPVFGWIASNVSKRRIVPAFYSLFVVTILLFYLLMKSNLYRYSVAIAFFIWLSIFNLFVVSVFWSFMVDVFSEDQSQRLFGFIAAGGTTGAIVGPLLTSTLPPILGTDNLLLLSAVLLLGTLICIQRILNQVQSQPSPPEEDSSTRDKANLPGEEEFIGGNLWDGFLTLCQSPYLLGIGLFIVLYSGTSTFVYFEQAHIIERVIDSSAHRTQVFALMDFGVNTLTLLGQILITGRLMDYLGPGPSLASLPLVTVIGFLALALSPLLTSIVVFQIVRRSSNYALARPAREVLFSPLRDEDQYKGKNVVDTLVYRGGDAATGWFFAGLQAIGFGLMGISLVGATLATGWIVLSVALATGYHRLTHD